VIQVWEEVVARALERAKTLYKVSMCVCMSVRFRKRMHSLPLNFLFCVSVSFFSLSRFFCLTVVGCDSLWGLAGVKAAAETPRAGQYVVARFKDRA
jgi:hypothetical protein